MGHMSHLIQDMNVPAHVHNDPHGPTLILGKLDSFETYMAKPNSEVPANVRLWNYTQAPQPELNSGWRPEPFMVRSVDGEGIKLDQASVKFQFERFKQGYRPWFDKYLDQDKKGVLPDEECYFQGCLQIPTAISNTAELLLRFRQAAGQK
jgi:hypothetical protein